MQPPAGPVHHLPPPPPPPPPGRRAHHQAPQPERYPDRPGRGRRQGAALWQRFLSHLQQQLLQPLLLPLLLHLLLALLQRHLQHLSLLLIHRRHGQQRQRQHQQRLLRLLRLQPQRQVRCGGRRQGAGLQRPRRARQVHAPGARSTPPRRMGRRQQGPHSRPRCGWHQSGGAPPCLGWRARGRSQPAIRHSGRQASRGNNRCPAGLPAPHPPQKELPFGQSLKLVGSHPALGAWDETRGLPMTWGDGHVWTGEVPLPIGTAVEFKVGAPRGWHGGVGSPRVCGAAS